MKLLLPLLTVLFVGLKLTGFIAWNWFWVISPMVLPLIVVVVMFLFVLILASGDIEFIKKEWKKK